MARIIWSLALSCLLVATVNADFDNGLKIVNPGDDITLWPTPSKQRAVTKWNFETCEGCRISLSCVVLIANCDDLVITINDGQTTKKFCGIDYALRNSYRNKISLQMENAGDKTGAYCRIQVTKPYTNMKYEIIDSSEHGLGRGATKTTSCKCGWTNKSPGRIVNGKEAGINEYPFAVLIMLKRKQYPYCGGSIITAYHVLTAAHCTKPFRGLRLAAIVGEHDIENDKETPFTRIIDVQKTYEHPDYVERMHHNDIAVMKLKERIQFNDAVGPVCLPSFSNKNLINEYIKVMGWGLLENNGTASSVLRKVDLKVIDFDVCKTIFASVNKDSKYQICTWAPDKDSCQGDSGGPLVWQNPETKRLTQVALVSFGRDCGSPDPAVNSDVSYFMGWIRQIVQETAPEEICV